MRLIFRQLQDTWPSEIYSGLTTRPPTHLTIFSKRLSTLINKKRELNHSIHQEIERIAKGQPLRVPRELQTLPVEGTRVETPITLDEMRKLGSHNNGYDKSTNRHCNDCLVCRTDHFGVPRDWEEQAREHRVRLKEQKGKMVTGMTYLNEAAHHLTHELVLEELESLRLLRLLKKFTNKPFAR